MTYTLTPICVDGRWHDGIIVQTDTLQSFPMQIEIPVGDKVDRYLTNGVYKHIVEEEHHYYWFLIVRKVDDDSKISELMDIILGADDDSDKKLLAEQVNQSVNASSIAFVVLAQSEQIDDVTITEHSNLFPLWDENWVGKVNTIVLDDGQLYKKINADFETPYPQSRPSKDKSQWKLVGNPADEWPEWSQPLGAHDAYTEGMKCSYNGKHWVCNVASTTYPPGIYGWKEA